MNLTLPEVEEQRDRLRHEIMERQCLLAAFDVMHGYIAQGGKAGPSTQLTPLITNLLPSVALPAAAELPPPQPPNQPTPPAVQRYVHPDLRGSTRDTFCVRWALERLPQEFTLHDIAALLPRQGYEMRHGAISTVLTRMKRERKIKELERSHGPHPARLWKPEGIVVPEIGPEDAVPESEAGTAVAAPSPARTVV